MRIPEKRSVAWLMGSWCMNAVIPAFTLAEDSGTLELSCLLLELNGERSSVVLNWLGRSRDLKKVDRFVQVAVIGDEPLPGTPLWSLELSPGMTKWLIEAADGKGADSFYDRSLWKLLPAEEGVELRNMSIPHSYFFHPALLKEICAVLSCWTSAATVTDSIVWVDEPEFKRSGGVR